jgi:[ribosomal protein S5]-alanine N-acetyltransferase
VVSLPALTHRHVTVRGVKLRDSRALEKALGHNRAWLQPWEATHPIIRAHPEDTKSSIRSLLQLAKTGTVLPLVMEVDHELVGQLNVSQIVYGSLSQATLGYWIVPERAGQGITPLAVAMVCDYLFFELALHRVEICIRPENTASLRIVEKLGFRFEGFRRNYIHIDRRWRDHYCFGLVVEEVPKGVVHRFESGMVPPGLADVPEFVKIQARQPLHIPPR